MAEYVHSIKNCLFLYKRGISSTISVAHRFPDFHAMLKIKGKVIPVTGREGA
jgi:hypothetical protein